MGRRPRTPRRPQSPRPVLHAAPTPARPQSSSAWGDRLSAHLERLASSSAAGPSDAPARSPGYTKAAAAAALAAGGALPIPQPVFGPIEDSRGKLEELVALFEPSRLAGQTRLLDDGGKCLREGASLLLSAAPGGVVVAEGGGPGVRPLQTEGGSERGWTGGHVGGA